MYRNLVSGLVSVCVAAALGACALDEEAAGTVELDLIGQAPSGNVYVLRNAEITVTELRSGNTRVFRSDDDVNATRFRAHLLTGSYTARLAPGWRLDRRVDGVDTPAPAVALTSPNPASFDVTAGATTRVALQFTVGGDGVTLEAGDLDIEVEVAEPEVGSIGNRTQLGASISYSSEYLFAQRFDLAGDATLLRLGHIGQYTGAQCRFSVYRDNVDMPGALVVETGPVTVSGQTETEVAPTELTLGRYWLAAVCGYYPMFAASPSQFAETRRLAWSTYSPLPQNFPASHETVLTQAVNFYAIVDFH